MNTKLLDRILLFLLILLLVSGLGLLSSCRSVKKTQHTENTEVHGYWSDSTVKIVQISIDTTETSEKTTVTEYEIEVDSIGYQSGNTVIGYGNSHDTLRGSWSTPLGYGPWPNHPQYAKGVKIKAKVTETAKAEKKGQTAEQSTSSQVIKKDTAAAAAESDNDKKSTGANPWLLLWLIPLALTIAWWKRGWIIDQAVKRFT